MFNDMMHDIQRETVAHLFRTKFEIEIVHMGDEHVDTELSRAAENFVSPDYEAEPAKVGAKVGRNDVCPCGSGLKFKKCCGADRVSNLKQ